MIPVTVSHVRNFVIQKWFMLIIQIIDQNKLHTIKYTQNLVGVMIVLD